MLAEYGETCRSALQDWLDRSPSAWDWTPYIKHVVCDLEGKDESEVPKHEEALWNAVKAIVPCDITKDPPPIAKGYEGPYDVVMSMLCIENGCLTRDDYKAAVRRIATLVKRDKSLLLEETMKYSWMLLRRQREAYSSCLAPGVRADSIERMWIWCRQNQQTS